MIRVKNNNFKAINPKNIESLMDAKFIKITSSGMLESHPHDVTITRESPNYNIR